MIHDNVGDRRQEKIKKVVSQRQRDITVVLEDIHDPHNIAAILRTCDAFGIQDIVCVYEKEKYVSPKKVGKSSSSSANKWLDFTVYRSSVECVQALKANGYRLFVTMLDETAQPLYDTSMSEGRVALVFGNEHAGVSEAMSMAADVKLYVPMRGMVQSLNVSVTAAICIAELSRQRQTSGKYFSIGKPEQESLAKDFSTR